MYEYTFSPEPETRRALLQAMPAGLSLEDLASLLVSELNDPDSDLANDPVIGGGTASVRTMNPTTAQPTVQPTTNQPTVEPTGQPTTQDPTQEPTTLQPTSSPTREGQTQTCEFDVAKYSCPKGVVEVMYASLGRDEKLIEEPSEALSPLLARESFGTILKFVIGPMTDRVAQDRPPSEGASAHRDDRQRVWRDPSRCIAHC